MGLRVDRHDRNHEKDGEADDGREVAHDRVEVAEHLDTGQLPHPHEGLHLEEDLETAGAPARALLEDLAQVLRRLPRDQDVAVVAAVPPGGGHLEREQKVLGDRLGGKPADGRERGSTDTKVGAAADGRAPGVEARLHSKEEGAVLVVEDVAGVVDVEEVLRRLHQRGARVLLEVGERVMQEVGVRLHVGVEDHNHVVLARYALRKDDELEGVVQVARLAVHGQAGVLWPGHVDEALVPHVDHRLLALQVPPVVEEIHHHLCPRVREGEGGLARREHDVRRLVVAGHEHVHIVARQLWANLDRRRLLVVGPRLRESDHRQHHDADRAKHLRDADGALVVEPVGDVPLDRVDPPVPKVGWRHHKEEDNDRLVKVDPAAALDCVSTSVGAATRGSVKRWDV
mmetsp:Transcript_46799/g.155117  ORF Transcript_46799/g.155117 Transcript_46799/m.155117 type:complete len:399 (+) Transcript_46799:1040-2236(+)